MKKSNDILKELGFFSSHPAALQRSRKVFLLCSLVPIAVFICVLVGVCSDFDSCKRMLLHPGWPVKIFVAFVCATAGAVFCVCLMNFLAICKKTSQDDNGEDKDRRPFSAWVILLFALAWTIPWGVSRFKNSIWNGPYIGMIEFVLNLMCLLPFFWICVFLLVRGRRKTSGYSIKLPVLPLVFGIASLVISALPFFTDLHSGLAALFPNSRIAQTLHQSLLRVVLFGLFFPIGTMFLCLFRVKVERNRDSSQNEEGDDEGSRQSDSRDIAEILRVLNRYVDKCDSKKVSWKDVPRQLPFAANTFVGKDKGRQDDQRNYGVLLNGKVPTPSQCEFLCGFRDSYEDYVAKLGNDESVGNLPLDFIIHGADGSGRTDALCATALLAVLTRGDKVLFFVKDDLAAKVVRMRIAETVRRMLLADYSDQHVAVKILERGDFSKWIEDEHHIAAAPDILIAHPSVFEKETFSGDFSAAEHLRAVDVLLEYSTLLVDDVLEYDASVLAHLGFLLKKLRLLLSANGRISQIVAVASEMLSESFPVRYGKYKAVEFAPRTDVDVWCGTLQVEKGDSTETELVNLANSCVEDGLCVAIFGFGGETRAALSRKVVLVDRLEDWELEMRRSHPVLDVIICLGNGEDSVTTALRCNLMNDDSALVYVREADGPIAVRRPLKMLLPNNTSKAMCYAHLRSLLPFMFPKMPLDERSWNMFGVRWDDKAHRGMRPESGVVDVVTWVYDALSGNGYDIKPQLVLLTNYMSHSVKIDYAHMPDVVEALWQTDDGIEDREVHLGFQEGDNRAADSSCHAGWRDLEGNDLGKTDLTNGDSLVCAHDGVHYWCDCIVSGSVEDCAMILRGVRCNGTDKDHVIPERSFKWTLPEDVEIGDLKFDSALRMARFCIPDRVGIRAECCLTGVMNKVGHVDNSIVCRPGGEFVEASYGFRVNLTGLILSPVPEIFSPASKSESKRKLPFGDKCWGTNVQCGYSPCLTHALTAVFRSRFEGFTFYASLFAFVTRGYRDGVGDVLIWIVEPEKTGRVCSRIVLDTFNNQDEQTEELVKEALQLIKEVGNGGIEKLRILSGVAYSGDVLTDEDIDAACDILEQVLRSKEERNKEAEDNRERIKEFRETRRDRRRLTGEAAQEEEFDKTLLDGFLEFRNEIEVSKFAKTIEDGGYGWPVHRITDSYEDFLWNHPEIFYVRKSWHYSVTRDSQSKRIKRFVFDNFLFEKTPGLAMTPERYADALRKLRAERDRALQSVSGVVNPIEKARLLHDYLIRICDYNHAAKGNPSVYARTAYSVLVDHEAVCEGYTMAYRYLLDSIGIECEEVVSDEMNHCWNYVRFNGHWYHVDVTWDDLGRKNGGVDDVQYTYFLLSDKAMRERKHDHWFTRGLPPATDTWYDNFKWGDVAQKTGTRENKANGSRKAIKTEPEDPLEKYRRHVAFMAQNQGCSLYCRGKIVLRVFFVDDVESCWTDEARMQFKRMVSLSVDKLLADSKCDGVSMEFLAVYADKCVSRAVEPPKAPRLWIDEIFGTSGIVEDQGRFRTAIECDESPIIFAFNKEFRSCAHMSEGQPNVGRNHPEWSMVSYQQSEDERVTVHTIVHELLHQFGAPDLYYPKRVTEAAEKCLGESIMNRGMAIDDLTRVSIGWRDKLTDKAIAFLEATKGVTEAQVIKARREEWKRRWHGG